MVSKSRIHGERNRGRRGLGKAFDASRPKTLADQKVQDGAGRGSNGGRADFENSKKKPKVSNISFKPTSNGGRGGQQGKAGAQGASLLKELQVKRLAKKLADLNDREICAGRGNDGACADKYCEEQDPKMNLEGVKYSSVSMVLSIVYHGCRPF